ncbi:MAG: hypothetical protein K2Q15_07920 [Burkholderiales bacterium]|nr:hypothetical protein [Burkholderiales bacterium]
MQVLIGNLPLETTVEDVRSLLTDEIGLNEFGDICLADGGKDSVIAMVLLHTQSPAAADVLTEKVSNFFWKGRNLTASHTHMFTEE